MNEPSMLKDLVGGSANKEALIRQKESRARRDQAEHDFDYFCKTYLPHYFFSEGAEYHGILTDIFNSRRITEQHCTRLRSIIKEDYWSYFKPMDEIKAIIDAEPREHGKSVRASFAFPLWCGLYKKRNFTLLIGPSSDSAEDNLSNLTVELEENELILEDFGDMKGDTWTNKKIVLSNGTCFMARGAGGSMRGVRHRENRPDMVICDDILKDDAAESPTQRDKIFRWVKRVVLPLGKKVFLIFVNTIFHDDDLICRLLGEIEDGKHSDWIGLRFSCWLQDSPALGPLWPGNWSTEDLNKREEDMGPTPFSTEMRNEPLSDDARIFRPEWIAYYDPSSVNEDGLRKIGAVDPATGAHDMSGIPTIGIPKEKQAVKRIYVIDGWGETCSDSKMVSTLVIKYLYYRHEKIGFETVSFQKIYKDRIVEEAAREGVYLPITEVKPGGLSKEARIRKLAPLIENGIIQFHPARCKRLIEQLLSFPKGTYDDIPDALAYAVDLATEGSGNQKAAGAGKKYRRIKTLMRGYRG